VAFLLSARDV